MIAQRGFRIYPGYLDSSTQEALVEQLRQVLQDAPLVQPVTPRGKPMSVLMSAAGLFGWITDRRGYRYEQQHPSGVSWPEIPKDVLSIWDDLADCARQPECCLINWYGEGARMGLHRDEDEADFSCPVVSVSLGDSALFRMGGAQRSDKTESIWLSSGDVVVMAGAARLAYHGIDRIRFGSSGLLPRGGRINLTLRVVT
jgi:alkylated DNA repair protein (DNA oxidative demethylase)